MSVRGHFSEIDYAIFILLIVVSVAIGVFVGFRGWKNATTKDFLVGGRKMHPIPVALSLIGGVVSALSVLGNATEIYLHGTQLWMNIIGCFWGTLVIIFILLPTLYPLELISMMQYLELRYDSILLKKMGSTSQIINMCLYLGICLYAPSLALSSVTSLSSPASIVCLGLVCTLYISIGGVKAVVYTDVVQTSIMFIGILTVITVVCVEMGGISTVFEIAEEGGRLEFFNFDLNPLVRHTFWSVQILGLYFVVSVAGISQGQFQRLNSVRTLRQSQALCVMFYIGLVLLWSLFNMTGLVAYAAYVDCDPKASKQIEKADQILPFLVADKLSRFPGMPGLFVAAVYGAVLSSVSSTASAFAALVWEDFLSSWIWFRKNVPIAPTNVTRLLSAFAGLLGIAVAFVVGQLGTLSQAAFSILGAFISPMDGLIVTSISAPWVTEKGAVIGFITAFIFNLWLVVGKYMNHAGKAEPLPLSTDGCSSAFMNSSSVNYTTENFYTSAFPEELEINGNIPERDYLALYDISYCFIGTMGILIVFTVSSVVSLVTGPNNPHDVDPRYVYKPSLKVYKWLWSLFSKRKNVNIESSNNADKYHQKDIHDTPNSHAMEFQMIPRENKVNPTL